MTFRDVCFSYDDSAMPLLEDLRITFGRGWTGIVGVNGAGKTTLLKLAVGLLTATEGYIARPDTTIYCAQRTDDPPDALRPFLKSQDALSSRLKGVLRIDASGYERWNTLSHGERKRTQIATALWREPSILAVDEPTNHLDMEARNMLSDALHAFRGVGLIVSHDRDLLDDLCLQCVFIDPPHAVVRPGGVTRGWTELRKERDHDVREYRQARNEYQRLKRESARRRELADQQLKRRSKRGIAKHDHDAKAKKDFARVTGKDGVAGRLYKQMEGRLRQAEQKWKTRTLHKSGTLGIWLPESVSRRDTLFSIGEGNLILGSGFVLFHPTLCMRPEDRVALTGPNGSGKSTLLRAIRPAIPIPGAHIVFIPQEIPSEEGCAILETVKKEPENRLGHIMTIVSRLGSDPQRLLESVSPSPGETRKLLLALGISRLPHLIIMDEPTNHLDIIAIECIEKALSDCPCGLLLVSHDRRFLSALTRKRWEIRPEEAHAFILKEIA